MNRSEKISEITAAILKIKKAAIKVPKKGENPYYNSKYAALDDVLNALRSPLLDNGLLVMQHPEEHHLTTLIVHPSSGEWIESRANLIMTRNDPQALGSAITYMRRYALCSIFFLEMEDDDANTASTPVAENTKTASSQGPKPLPGKLVKEIEAAATVEELEVIWINNPKQRDNQFFKNILSKRKKELQ